jgi:hypothetical protein
VPRSGCEAAACLRLCDNPGVIGFHTVQWVHVNWSCFNLQVQHTANIEQETAKSLDVADLDKEHRDFFFRMIEDFVPQHIEGMGHWAQFLCNKYLKIYFLYILHIHALRGDELRTIGLGSWCSRNCFAKRYHLLE